MNKNDINLSTDFETFESACIEYGYRFVYNALNTQISSLNDDTNYLNKRIAKLEKKADLLSELKLKPTVGGFCCLTACCLLDASIFMSEGVVYGMGAAGCMLIVGAIIKARVDDINF